MYFMCFNVCLQFGMQNKDDNYQTQANHSSDWNEERTFTTTRRRSRKKTIPKQHGFQLHKRFHVPYPAIAKNSSLNI